MRMITILGPSHAGKSTLAAALAGLEGRGAATPVSDHVTLHGFSWLGDGWVAADVVGGPDHLGAAAEALAASDAAVLVAPPEPEAAPLVAPYLRLVEEAGLPVVLFINKMDAAQARVRDVVAALQDYARHPIILRQAPIRDGDAIVGAVDLISERAWKYNEGRPSDLIELPASAVDREHEAREALLEHLSEFDDALLEQLIEDRRPATAEVFDLAGKVLEMGADIPTYLGAASHAHGVVRLMKALRHETPSGDAAAARLPDGAVAVGFAADIRRHMGKVTALRAFGDGVRAGAPLGGAAIGALIGLDGKTPVDAVSPGGIALAAKADHLAGGRVFSAGEAVAAPDWTRARPPAYRRLVTPANERDDARLSGALARLAEVEPGLEAGQDVASGHAVLTLQGPMHMRRIMGKLEAEFGVAATEAESAPAYRETITRRVEHHHRHKKQSGGAGQFADVALTFEPLERGAGFVFEDVVKGGAVPKNYIPSVEAGVREALASGPLGFPAVDVKAVLTDGKHHAVDSSDHAFRMAGAAATREALREAGPVLLQPVEQVEIHVPSVYSGGLVAVVSGLKGQVLGFEAHGTAKGWDVFRALMPGSALEGLFRDLAGATQGTAWFEARFDHYEELRGREAEAIVEARAA